MTFEETAQVMDLIVDAYPRFYISKSDADRTRALTLWAAMFADDPLELVLAALKALIATSEWPPSVSEVKERIRWLVAPDEMSEAEAWELVAKAVRNGIYGSEDEFAALPPEIQRLVGSANQLREWAMTDLDSFETVVASNFQRAYRARMAKEREMMLLPESVRKTAAALAERFKMPGLTEGEA